MKRAPAIAMLIATSLTMALLGAGQSFDLSWHTVDGGGGMSSVGGSFELAGTIGQPDAKAPPIMTGGTFALEGGFWPGIAPVAETCRPDIEPLPNGDGMVNVDDLLYVINHWGACAAPPAQCIGDIAPVNGNGVVDVDDLLSVINEWGACPS